MSVSYCDALSRVDWPVRPPMVSTGVNEPSAKNRRSKESPAKLALQPTSRFQEKFAPGPTMAEAPGTDRLGPTAWSVVMAPKARSSALDRPERRAAQAAERVTG